MEEDHGSVNQANQHLLDICTKLTNSAASAPTSSIVKEVNKVSKPLSASVDKRHLTVRARAEYHDLVFEG